MATESPLIHDGSQTTAASGDLATAQFYAVKLVGARSVDLANAGGEPIYGILQNTPLIGQAADVGIIGVSKAMIGAPVAAGAQLMTDTTARLITATSTNHRVAVALEAGGTAGQVISVALSGLGNAPAAA